MDRNLALGTSYYFLLLHQPSELALAYIDRGLLYDPYAADLLNAKIYYSYALGKNDEMVRALTRLSVIAPNSVIKKKAN